MRQKFEMTEAQLQTLLEACRSGPLIALQCGMPPSPQERANRAWEVLGKEMGFQHMTVEPAPGGQRFFTAEPAALRSKPAASEGDGPTPQVGTARYMDGQYWFPQSAMERFGLAVADAREKRLANTSKQAAVEAVAWCAGLEATADGWISTKAWRDGEFTTPLYLHPPRHPADEDAELTAFVRGIYERMSRSYEINNRILYGDMQYLFDFATSRKIVLIPALQAGTPT